MSYVLCLMSYVISYVLCLMSYVLTCSFLLYCRGVQPGLRCARCVRVRRVRVRGRLAWATLRRAELRPTLLRARHVLQRNVPLHQRLERQALHPRG